MATNTITITRRLPDAENVDVKEIAKNAVVGRLFRNKADGKIYKGVAVVYEGGEYDMVSMTIEHKYKAFYTKMHIEDITFDKKGER